MYSRAGTSTRHGPGLSTRGSFYSCLLSVGHSIGRGSVYILALTCTSFYTLGTHHPYEIGEGRFGYVKGQCSTISSHPAGYGIAYHGTSHVVYPIERLYGSVLCGGSVLQLCLTGVTLHGSSATNYARYVYNGASLVGALGVRYRSWRLFQRVISIACGLSQRATCRVHHLSCAHVGRLVCLICHEDVKM